MKSDVFFVKCVSICPVAAISFKNKKAFIDQKLCVGCGECLCACGFNAILINWREDPLIFCKRMAEVCDYKGNHRSWPEKQERRFS